MIDAVTTDTVAIQRQLPWRVVLCRKKVNVFDFLFVSHSKGFGTFLFMSEHSVII